MNEKFKFRKPKEGDFIRISEHYKKKFLQSEKYFTDIVWAGGVVKVISVEEVIGNILRIFTQPSLYKNPQDYPYVYTFTNGYMAVDTITPLIEVIYMDINNNTTTRLVQNSSLFCTCGGPTKESYTLNEKFLICTVCKKEAIK